MLAAMKRATKIIVFAALAVVVLVVGGTYLYIHVIEGDAPEPLSISTDTTSGSGSGSGTTTANSTAAAVAGTWKPTSASKVGYRVKEVLFGQNSTAVGRTNAVTGAFVIDGTTVTTASFTADMTKVNSDRSQRDNQFHGRIMDTATFPTATFKLTSPIDL